MSALTRLTYQVLLALADGDLHGYGVIKEIEERDGASAAPSTGALYLALQRMQGEGLIDDTSPPADGGDRRRRYYRITDQGRQLAEEESRRLEGLVAAARAKNLLAEGRA